MRPDYHMKKARQTAAELEDMFSSDDFLCLLKMNPLQTGPNCWLLAPV